MTKIRTRDCSTPGGVLTKTLESVLTDGNDGGGKQIKNIADPTADQDTATKKYVDDEIAADQHFRGTYVSLVALQTAIPTGTAGDYADVDAGVGTDVQRYIWDVDDAEWIAGGGGSSTVSTDDVTVDGDGSVGDPINATKGISLEDVSEKTDDYPLVLTDAFKTIPVNAATSKTVTVPLNSSVAFPVGTLIAVRWQTGAGQPAIAAAGGVTINNTAGNLLVPVVNSTVVLKKTATNTWFLNNGLAAGGGGGSVDSVNGQTGVVVLDAGDLGATTVGENIFELTNPSAISYLRVNADNTVTALTPTQLRQALGATMIHIFHRNIPETVNSASEVLTTNFSFNLSAAAVAKGTTIEANDTIEFKYRGSRSGTTNTFTTQITFNTSLSLTGDVLVAVLATSAAQKWVPILRSIAFKNALNSQRVFSTALNTTTDDMAAQSNSIDTDLTVDFAAGDIYFQTTVAGNGTTDTYSCEELDVWLIKPVS